MGRWALDGRLGLAAPPAIVCVCASVDVCVTRARRLRCAFVRASVCVAFRRICAGLCVRVRGWACLWVHCIHAPYGGWSLPCDVQSWRRRYDRVDGAETGRATVAVIPALSFLCSQAPVAGVACWLVLSRLPMNVVRGCLCPLVLPCVCPGGGPGDGLVSVAMVLSILQGDMPLQAAGHPKHAQGDS